MNGVPLNNQTLYFVDFLNTMNSQVYTTVELQDYGECVHLDQTRYSLEEYKAYKNTYYKVSMICGFQHNVW